MSKINCLITFAWILFWPRKPYNELDINPDPLLSLPLLLRHRHQLLLISFPYLPKLLRILGCVWLMVGWRDGLQTLIQLLPSKHKVKLMNPHWMIVFCLLSDGEMPQNEWEKLDKMILISNDELLFCMTWIIELTWTKLSLLGTVNLIFQTFEIFMPDIRSMIHAKHILNCNGLIIVAV